jgi:hypothetical protein
MDYANEKYDRSLVDDVKILLQVLWMYLPLPVFWALFDQQVRGMKFNIWREPEQIDIFHNSIFWKTHNMLCL